MRKLLHREGIGVSLDVVETRDGFLKALTDGAYDLVLADYRLPGFNGHEALEIARQAAPETPFIVVSGTIGEEVAVDLLKRGAADCVLKDRLARLPFAVRRALDAAREQAAHQLAEEALRESEQRLALTLEATNDGMWDWNIPTGNAVFSPRYYTMLGYEPYEFPQSYQAWRKLVHRRDIRAAGRAIDAAVKGGGNYAFEARMRTKTSGWCWVLSRGKVVERDAEDRPVRMVGTHTDVSDLHRAEQAAAERSHFLEELLEALPVPVFYKDSGLRYVGCNGAFARSLGRAKDEVIGKTGFDVFPAELATRFDASDRVLLAHPKGPREDDNEIPTPDGASRYLLTHKAVFSDVAGTPVGIVGVNLDVTEIRQAQKDLASSAMRLRQTLKATVAALGATTEMRDPYTAGHQRRVAALAAAIAAELSWDEGRIEALRTAALLHDIGKIVVPAEILSKPGLLGETEMLLIRQHADAGADTIADIDFEADVATMIRQHHERLNGSGYPAGLRGAQILPEARILAVADTVEAMISHRPYRASLPIAKAMAEIQGGAETRYDADAVAACVRLFREQGFALEG
jgi:PAS domain S-box-containing protein/putative nucleotidyltransferase with HDIG domain